MISITKLITYVLISIFCIAFSLAATPGEAFISNATDLGEYILQSPDTVTAEAGNISQANLDANMSTFRWAGLVGNVSGSIVLGDANEDVMFEWDAVGNLVYASQSATINWPALADADKAAVVAEYSYLVDGTSDAYNNTFGSIGIIGSNIFTTILSDFAYTKDSFGLDVWRTFSLTDGSAIIFAGEVLQGFASYSGADIGFQMILPEDGTAGDETPQSYNLWVELK